MSILEKNPHGQKCWQVSWDNSRETSGRYSELKTKTQSGFVQVIILFFVQTLKCSREKKSCKIWLKRKHKLCTILAVLPTMRSNTGCVAATEIFSSKFCGKDYFQSDHSTWLGGQCSSAGGLHVWGGTKVQLSRFQHRLHRASLWFHLRRIIIMDMEVMIMIRSWWYSSWSTYN